MGNCCRKRRDQFPEMEENENEKQILSIVKIMVIININFTGTIKR
jgi:hypothetical protein